MLTSPRYHICVCICTYKRPEPLRRLLSKLETQETRGLFGYSIVIVDNDHSESARQAVESNAIHSKLSISYYIQPEQNIALARNKAIENAEGDFIALIDDDEFPLEDWLLNHYKAIHVYGADGILGPVLPEFEREPPGWVIRGRFFDRPSHPDGHVLAWQNTRTGNALLKKDVFQGGSTWFDPAFGSGGEDRDFFRRKIESGHVFVWCNSSPVFEIVPPERWNRTVMIKRALLRGKMALNAKGERTKGVLNSVIAIVAYTACLPFLLFLGQHVFMKYLIKNCDHIGKVSAFFGFDLVRERYVSG